MVRPHGVPSDAIAVIGVACRLPGALDPARFWDLLRSGTEAVTEPPEGRFGPDSDRQRGGFLNAVDGFDAEFFGVSPREAAAMDPQQRLALELSWEALEHARLVPDALRGSRIGVFLGAMSDEYAALVRRGGPDVITPHTMTGLHRSLLANRISHVLGLRGPSLTVDTGQSSSLVAVHLAGESLRRGESTTAVVGGVNLLLDPDAMRTAREFGALSPDGRCYAFDVRANGFVRGEGGVMLVLKPAAAAVADGDRVLCLLLGSAVNNDGHTDGLTVPSRTAQEDVLRQAYAVAGVDTRQVQYVESHGTGTRVGDPVEAAALGAVLGAGRAADRPLAVGSVKTNVGHLEGGAGVVGLLKTVLAITHRELPPSLNLTTPNPAIPFAELGLRVRTEHGQWPAGDAPLVAGVSSFGMGGTNCHVVLVEPPPRAARPDRHEVGHPVPWVLSGRDGQALRAVAANLSRHLNAESRLADIGFSLATTRTAFEHRACVVGRDLAEFRAGLAALSRGERCEHVVIGSPSGGGLALLFPGQGFQRPGMGRALYAAFPAFADAFDAACAALDPHLSRPLREVVWAEEDSPEAALLDQTEYAQPALFAVGVALSALLDSSGVRTEAVAGHSLGEITAAHVTGVLSLPDAARLVAVRGRLMQAMPSGGAMVSLQASEAEVAELVRDQADRVAVAAVNGPGSVVVSGAEGAVAEIATHYTRLGRRTTVLRTSHAFHSPLVDPILDALRAAATGLTPAGPQRAPLVSTLTGRPATVEELCSPEHWVGHARRPVRFGDGVVALHDAGARVFLQVGPGHELALLGQTGVSDPTSAFHPCVDGPEEERAFVRALGWAHVNGVEIDWRAVFGPDREPVDLPTYPFQRERHWFDRTPVAIEHDGHATEPARRLTSAPEPERDRLMLDLVLTEAATVLGHETTAAIPVGRPFRDLGFDSRRTVELTTRLADATGLQLPTVLPYDHPTPERLARHLRNALFASSPADPTTAPRPVTTAAARDDPIAIVAMSCRYPGGVNSPEDLWRLVRSGTDALSGFPTDRGWDIAGLYDPRPGAPGRSYTRHGGFLLDADRFDAAFFGIPPREATAMDPQQRILLETTWELFERAGLDPAGLRGSRVGVFVGATTQDYGPRLHEVNDEQGGFLLTGTTASVLSGRVAYVFDFAGPALTVDTACSSSLVALHLAARSLRAGECTLAVAGGVTVMSSPGMFVEFSRQRGLAPDGRCKPFAAAADGTAWAEGAGLLLLERLSDARHNGHGVLAVLRGSATNQDGASNGLSAPSGPAQEAVIRAALADAGLSPADVSVVEAHGTGTALGDPVEAGALLATYGRDRPADRPVWLGSVKSNIGHTQAAAGVAGIIKMVQAFGHDTLPATLHVDQPSPHVDWSAGGLALATRPVPWPRDDRPRRAAVSSFGISGTNAHVVLEEPPAVAQLTTPAGGNAVVPWVLSGRSAAALRAQATRLGPAARAAEPTAVGYALATTRSAFEHRAVVLGAGREELLAGVAAVAAGEPAGSVVMGRMVKGGTVFVFPGQGSQWVGMAAELVESSPVFRECLHVCADALSEFIDWSLLDVLRARPGAPSLDGVEVVQPALFAMMVSLAAVWRAHGVEPAAVVGHSQGEIAAAHIAGALSLRDAARVVALRSRLLAELAGTGGMASVPLPEDEVCDLLARLPGGIHVAAVNGPRSTVVAGPPDALDRLLADCAAYGVKVSLIDVDYASHGPSVEVLRVRLVEALAELRPQHPAIPFCSTRTGDFIDRLLDADYWYGNLRDTVRLQDAVCSLLTRGHRLFVEVSPHPMLTVGVQDTAQDAGVEAVATGTLRRGQGDTTQMLTALAAAYVSGAKVDWRTVLPTAGPVELPTYAFQGERFWLADQRRPTGRDRAEHPLLDTAVPLAGSDGLLLAGEVSTTGTPWLADHAVANQVLLPGTAFLELALHAGRMLGCGVLEELTLEAPLVVPAEVATRIQVEVGAPDEAGRRPVSIHSRATEDDMWIRHASGVLGDAPMPAPAGEGDWPPADAVPVPVDGLYERLAKRDYRYGPAFRLLRAAWRHGGDLLAEVSPPGPTVAEFGVHPALLDAALHALLDLSDIGGDGRSWLPFSWQRVSLHGTGAAELRVRFAPKGTGKVSLTVTDGEGAPVASVAELSFRPARVEPTAESLFRVESVRVTGGPVETGLCWAVLGDDQRWAATAYPDAAALVDAVASGAAVPDVVLAPCPEPVGQDGPHAAHAAANHVLDLVQRWLDEPRLEPALLVVLTRPVLAHAVVAGLVRTAQSENPGRFLLVDVDDAEESQDALAAAVSSREPEVVIRRGELHAPRLAKPAAVLRSPVDTPAWHLDVTRKGSFEHIALVPCAHVALHAGEVRIAVRAAGVNFRDVTIALGLLEHEELIGSEGSGVVAEVGPDVTDLVPGDRVLGLFERAFGPYAVADRRTIARMPDGWSFARAASVPVVFLTAYQCLVELAGLRPGEAVLVHTGTGGVGMAAVQLAQHLGAEVFATASPAKWPVLRRMGLDDAHIASSRSLEFADRFAAEFDVVLNSLAGRFVDASLGLLRPGGRFVELGKTDIRSPEDVTAAHPGVTYQAYNLLDVPPDRVRELLVEVLELFAAGALAALPVTALDVRCGPEALRRLRDARHVGKLVLTVPRPLEPYGTVLLIGGTGTLGTLLARHMVTVHGVTRLLLAGRRGPDTPGVARLRSELAELGAEVDVAACDVADRDKLAGLLARIPAEHPLTAVVHLAGTLDNGVLPSLTRDQMTRVLRPKVDAAWHLHELTREMDLSAFVLFSSTAGVLGLPGQGNYAAANTFLDTLAEHRRASGLPALSLAWGFWAERSAMTLHLREADVNRMRRQGLVGLDAEEGLALFDAAFDAAVASLVPMRLDVESLREQAEVPPLLRGLVPTHRRRVPDRRSVAAASPLAQRLPTMSDDDRDRILLKLVSGQVATVLGHDGPEAVEPDLAFKEIGFDSLTGVELRNRLKAATGLALSSSLITDQTTVLGLSRELAQALRATTADSSASGSPAD